MTELGYAKPSLIEIFPSYVEQLVYFVDISLLKVTFLLIFHTKLPWHDCSLLVASNKFTKLRRNNNEKEKHNNSYTIFCINFYWL